MRWSRRSRNWTSFSSPWARASEGHDVVDLAVGRLRLSGFNRTGMPGCILCWRAGVRGFVFRRLESPSRKNALDFSDTSDSSTAQLNTMRRVGRLPLGDEPRRLIAIRVDAGVLHEFRKEARRCRVGYQTLINDVLARYVRNGVA